MSKFSLLFRVFSALRSALVNYSRQFIEREINGDSSTPKRRKLTDLFPEVPESEGPQHFPRGLRQYQPTDVPRRLARRAHTHTRVTFVPRQLLAGDETRLLIIRHAS